MVQVAFAVTPNRRVRTIPVAPTVRRSLGVASTRVGSDSDQRVGSARNSKTCSSDAAIRVEPSMKRIRLVPYGVHGRLRWGDLEASGEVRPAGVSADAPVEWVVGMPGQ